MRLEEENTKGLILWSYGHVIVFGGGVAIGAGFAVLVDMESRHADVSNLIGNLAVAIPIAFYLLGVWLVQDRFSLNCRSALVLPSCAILALVTPFFPFAIEALAALLIFALLSRYLLNAAQR